MTRDELKSFSPGQGVRGAGERRNCDAPKGIAINGREIGPGRPAYLIAEMSANHNGSLDRAKDIVRAAADAGADAIKLQTYTPDTMTLDCDGEPFRIKGTIWAGKTLHALYREAYTPWEWHEPLRDLAVQLGIDLFSTPFDATAVHHLEAMDVPAYKVASLELVDHPLLRVVAATGKPVILSTGASSMGEIEEAVSVLRESGCGELALLRCVSAYPAPPEEINLRTIRHLAETFGCISGLSDHSMGTSISVAAVALGACIIEKHFTLSREDPGPDSSFSMEPHEFSAMAAGVRDVEKAIGSVSYEVTGKQKESFVFRRSIFASADIRAGEPFTPENIRVVRPGYGLVPKYYDVLLRSGRASADIAFGTPLDLAMVSGLEGDPE